MQLLKAIGSVLVIVVIGAGLYYATLYLRYKSQQPAINDAAQTFMRALKADDTATLATITTPSVLQQVAQLESSSSDLLSRMAMLNENSNYFDYTWNFGTTENTTYKGVLTFDSGEKTNIEIRLEVQDGKWIVDNFNLIPISHLKFE